MKDYPIYRIAKVIDNIDEEKTGRIKVRVLPEMNGVPNDDLLPWITPDCQSETGTSEGVGIHNVPDVDSHITVRINDKYWTDINYLFESPRLSAFYPYSTFEEEFDIDELETTPEYPQPKFKRTADGVIAFHDTSQGILGVQHPTGAYVAIDERGQIFVKFIDKVKMKNDDETITLELNTEDNKIDIKADGGEVVITANDFTFDGTNYVIGGGGDSAVLFSPLEEILSALLSHVHTAPSGPTTPAEKSDKSPLTALKSKINDMKSSITTLD